MIEATFGEKLSNQTYVDRKGVYAIILNEKKEIAVVKIPHGYFLPGGGLEGDESQQKCLKRECIEELGWDIEINEYVCCADNYHFSFYRNKYLHSISYFYLVTKLEKMTEPIELDHELVWIPIEECSEKLFLKHQAYAVEKAVEMKYLNN